MAWKESCQPKMASALPLARGLLQETEKKNIRYDSCTESAYNPDGETLHNAHGKAVFYCTSGNLNTKSLCLIYSLLFPFRGGSGSLLQWNKVNGLIPLKVGWRFIWERTNNQTKALLTSYKWGCFYLSYAVHLGFDANNDFKSIHLIKLYQSITWSCLFYKKEKNHQVSSCRSVCPLFRCVNHQG